MIDNKTVCREFLVALGSSHVDGVLTRVTDDFLMTTMGTSAFSAGRDRDDVVKLLHMLAKLTVGGVELEIGSMTAEEDRVSVELKGRASLINGGRYDNVYHMLFRMRDGKIASINEYLDTKYVEESLGPVVRGLAVTE